MKNPFEELHQEIRGVSQLVQTLIEKQELDANNRLYTRKEAADILRVDVQTIDNYVKSGALKPFQKEEGGKKLFKHSELYTSNNEVKSLRYKR
jgi:predicted lipoprotein